MATFLQPSPTPAVPDDDDLMRLFQPTVSGVTGIPGNLVRPRWQPEPPNTPDFSTNWCAIGVTVTESDTFAFIQQVDDTHQLLERDQHLDVLMSFYGPGSGNLAGIFRDGIQIQQNRADLVSKGLKFQYVGNIRKLPALLKEKWVSRQDLTMRLSRRIRRVYAVNSITGLPDSFIDNELYRTPIVLPPAP